MALVFDSFIESLCFACVSFLPVFITMEEVHGMTTFSLFHNNKTYDYREYRFNNDILEICASNDSKVQAIWKTQNSWEKFKDWYKCNRTVHKLPAKHTVMNMQFTVYYAVTMQSIFQKK